jgi:hypothetical protein
MHADEDAPQNEHLWKDKTATFGQQTKQASGAKPPSAFGKCLSFEGSVSHSSVALANAGNFTKAGTMDKRKL